LNAQFRNKTVLKFVSVYFLSLYETIKSYRNKIRYGRKCYIKLQMITRSKRKSYELDSETFEKSIRITRSKRLPMNDLMSFESYFK